MRVMTRLRGRLYCFFLHVSRLLCDTFQGECIEGSLDVTTRAAV